MLGIGFFEIVIIALVCFIAFGPNQLPIMMRKLAGYYRQFLALRDEFQFQILSADDEKKKDDEISLPQKVKEVVAREERHG